MIKAAYKVKKGGKTEGFPVKRSLDSCKRSHKTVTEWMFNLHSRNPINRMENEWKEKLLAPLWHRRLSSHMEVKMCLGSGLPCLGDNILPLKCNRKKALGYSMDCSWGWVCLRMNMHHIFCLGLGCFHSRLCVYTYKRITCTVSQDSKC